MAEVYAARVAGAESFEKLVALKVMLPHLSGDPKFVRMFVDEARVAGRVESAHVVSTLDLGKDEHEGLYQVLELVIGSSLRQLLDAAEEPVPTRLALTVLAEVARGLADAHAARGADGELLGLVHRDVSPHNVLVGVDGRARLSDFGVARAAASVSATESGELKGKLAYAAPEQLRGETAVAASDVFALGVVIWEVLAGRRLFVAENPLALVDMMMTRPIPRLDEVRPELGAELADLCARALVREREERRVTAAELADRLDALARSAGGLASREEVGALVRARSGAALAELEATIRRRAVELAAAPLETSPVESTPKGAVLSRALGGAILALLVLVLGVTLWRGPGAGGAAASEAQTEPEPRSGTGTEVTTGSPREPEPSTGTGAAPEHEASSEPGSASSAEDVPGTETSAAAPAPEPTRPSRPLEATPRASTRDEPDGGASAVIPEGTAEDRVPDGETATESPPATEPGGGGLLGIEDFDRSGSH